MAVVQIHLHDAQLIDMGWQPNNTSAKHGLPSTDKPIVTQQERPLANDKSKQTNWKTKEIIK